MIYEVEGDILLTRAQLVVHNVTTFDPMNRGIARKLKDKYPAMAEAFHLWCGEAGAEPGDIWRWEASDHTQMIALITQEGDEDPTRIRRPDKSCAAPLSAPPCQRSHSDAGEIIGHAENCLRHFRSGLV